MKIKFNNREIELQFMFQADMIYENIQKSSFKAQTETEWIVYFYSTYLALTNDTDLDFDTCVKRLNEAPGVLFQFIKWYTAYQKNVMKLISQDVENEDAEKNA